MALRLDDSTAASGEASAERSLGRAFGLDLRLGFPVAGIRPGDTALGGRRTILALARHSDLEGDWGGGARVREWRDEAGRVEATLDHDDAMGWRLVADGFGAFAVSPAGDRIRCAPAEGEEAWRWQRCLIGQVLPLAALLNGLEVFHAAAVGVAGRAIGLVGTSQAGKSSVAVRLVLRGAELLADDVLALDGAGEKLTAHPGPGVVSVRHAEERLLEPGDRHRLGTVLGDDGEAIRMEVSRGRRPLPLAALYFLERGGAARDGVEPVWPPDPRLLLGSTFNFMVATPERLTNQLEICTRLARETPLFRVYVPAGTTAADVAARVEAHAAEQV